jgi:hypothetical protein
VLINPDDVDDSTVPVAAPEVAMIEIDDGGLLVDVESGRGYALNATGSLLWTLFDSVSPLGDLIDDVSAAFAAPRDEVAVSVHGMVRAFGALGLLANVRRDIASLPVEVEFVDVDECGEVIAPVGDQHSFDARYLHAPANA